MALLDSLHVEADGRYGAVSQVVSLVLTGASSPNRFRDRVVRVFIDGNLLDCELAALQRNVLVYFTGLDRIVSYRQNPQKRGLPCILKPDHGDVHLRRPACRSQRQYCGCRCSCTASTYEREAIHTRITSAGNHRVS